MMFFDTRDDDSIVIEVWSNEISGRILYGKDIPDLVREITAVTGRMQSLPEWTQHGAIVGLEGGTEHVQALASQLIEPDDDIDKLPIAAFWIQDWVGLRHAYGTLILWQYFEFPLFFPD